MGIVCCGHSALIKLSLIFVDILVHNSEKSVVPCEEQSGQMFLIFGVACPMQTSPLEGRLPSAQVVRILGRKQKGNPFLIMCMLLVAPQYLKLPSSVIRKRPRRLASCSVGSSLSSKLPSEPVSTALDLVLPKSGAICGAISDPGLVSESTSGLADTYGNWYASNCSTRRACEFSEAVYLKALSAPVTSQ